MIVTATAASTLGSHHRWLGRNLPHGENVERKELLEQALARVDPHMRSIFLLREAEGLSYHDIAEVLEIPLGTVGSRLNRARRELQQVLSDRGFELL